MVGNMAKLIILRGNSGSGKSTIARALQRKIGRNTMLIAQDMIRREVLWVKDGQNTLVLPLLKELLIYGSKHSEVVILEGIMYADWYDNLFEEVLKFFDSKVYAYYFDIPFEETVKRHMTRDKCTNFGEKEMQKWWKEKDYSRVLDEIIITAERSLDSIVNDIFNNAVNREDEEYV